MPMPTDHVARVSLSDEAYTRIEAPFSTAPSSRANASATPT